jgi:hypothetical protein
MIDIDTILDLPKEHRQIVQEVISYSVISELGMQVFTVAQKKFIEERLKRYCEEKNAVFKFEDLKSKILDKLP